MSSKTRVLIGSDHAGVDLKAKLKETLKEIAWIDVGTSSKERVDYLDQARALTEKLGKEEAHHGVLICGSGVGMCIAANKAPGVRAALVENPIAARLSKEHNDANVLCLGSRFLAPEYAAEIVKTWLETPFTNEPRHVERLRKVTALEKQTK